MIRMPATMHALSLRRFQSSCEIVIEKGAVEFYEVCALSMNARREGRTGVRPLPRRRNIDDCLRVAQMVALECAPPSPPLLPTAGRTRDFLSILSG